MVAVLALSGGDAGTTFPSSVKSLISVFGTRPAVYAAASLDRSVNESTVDCTSKLVFELTIVADRAERIVHPAAQSAVSPFRNRMTTLWYEPMEAYGLKYKKSSKRLISQPATLNTSCPNICFCRLVPVDHDTAVNCHPFAMLSKQHNGDIIST